MALISGCDNDPRPTRAYYHYEELEQKDNGEQKEDEEKDDEEDLQDPVDEITSEGKSTVIDGQDPNALTKLEKMLTPDLDG